MAGDADGAKCAYLGEIYRDVLADLTSGEDGVWVAAQATESGCVVFWEFFSGAGQSSTVLSALTSPAGRAVYVSANAHTSGEFAYAVDGVVLAEASSLIPGEVRGARPDSIGTAMAAAGVDLDDLRASDCLVLVEDLFGVTVALPGDDELLTAAKINPSPGPRHVPRERKRSPDDAALVPLVASSNPRPRAVRAGSPLRAGAAVARSERINRPAPDLGD